MPRLFLFMSMFIFCACQKSQEVIFETLYSDPAVSWKSIAKDDNLLYVAGGNQWEGGLIMVSDQSVNSWDIELQSATGFLEIDRFQSSIFAAGFNSNFVQKRNAIWEDKSIMQSSIIRGVAQNEQALIAVGGQAYFEGYVYRASTDGSFTTRDTLDAEVSDVVYVNGSIFIAVGYGSVYRSEDNGVSWNRLNVQGDFFRKIQFVNENLGFIVGIAGKVLRTEDSGMTWQEIKKGQGAFGGIDQMRSIYFEDESRGLIVGDQGNIQMTEDGGDSWTTIEGLPEEDYNDVFLLENLAIVLSEQGNIFRFDL